MMNPFTNFLSQWSRNKSFATFVEQWDVVEHLMVQVYREKLPVADAETQFNETWSWVRKQYPRWSEQIRPFWQQTKAAGKTTEVDPFQLILDIQHPQDILGDWRAMQHLPAAREAINQFILSESNTPSQ
jgi:hypothetical protein